MRMIRMKTINKKGGFATTTNRVLIKKRLKRSTRLVCGFTLLEMIIAVGVFTLAIFIAVSSFLTLQAAEKKIQLEANLQNNLRFALEVMAKEIRTGTSYHCGADSGTEPRDCTSGDDESLTFINALNQSVIYRKIGDSIQKSSNGGTDFQSLTASGIKIDDLSFYVIGSLLDDDIQPRVTITAKASGKIGGEQKVVVLQTTVSQRKPAP